MLVAELFIVYIQERSKGDMLCGDKLDCQMLENLLYISSNTFLYYLSKIYTGSTEQTLANMTFSIPGKEREI